LPGLRVKLVGEREVSSGTNSFSARFGSLYPVTMVGVVRAVSVVALEDCG
jgi:hypothetical protein